MHPASFTHNFVIGVQSVYLNESQDAMVLQTCHEKKCSGFISLQLDLQIWETASPRTHKPKIVNESLEIVARKPDFAVVSMHDMHRLALPIRACAMSFLKKNKRLIPRDVTQRRLSLAWPKSEHASVYVSA